MVRNNRNITILMMLIFVLYIILQLSLVSVNREANDNHIEVIHLILKSSVLPQKEDCWECFQPKLFHYTVAKFLQITALENLDQDRMILAVEMINFMAGVLTILVIGIFIHCFHAKIEALKVFCFGLVALNPAFIGIVSQATNDTFVIFFSTLALLSMFLFLQKRRLWILLLVLLFSFLSISSKTNGWVVVFAITLTLFLDAWMQKRRSTESVLLGCVFITATVALSIINPLNQYIMNYHRYGSPFVLNIARRPLPHLFEKTIPIQPGILSIQDGFFTFEFIGLIEHPRRENGDLAQDHQNSLWTQLYARANSIHYTNWPKSWSTTAEQNFSLSRALFILAIIPTVLLLFGVGLEIGVLFRSIGNRDDALASTTNYGLNLATFCGFVIFIILYSLLYRDGSVMKPIFIYPTLITFPLFFLRASESIDAYLKHRWRWVQSVFAVGIIFLFLLYTVDIVTMIQMLYFRRHGVI